MSRVLFSNGPTGSIVSRMQTQLAMPAAQIDGQYGKITATAVSGFQSNHTLPVTGEVDVDTWSKLMQAPIPTVQERALQQTAIFEGNGFSLAEGNFDGAGITWGIIGFTLVGGELGKVIKKIEAAQPGAVATAFGDKASQL